MRPRVLVVQPSLQPPGGGNGVAAWALQALQDDHSVGLLTWTPVDFDAVNRYYGTTLRASAFRTFDAAPFLRSGLDPLPFRLDLLKRALLFRAGRRIAPEWDVILSIHNEIDVGRRAIQYVHFPAYREWHPDADVRWYHGPRIVRESYYSLADTLARVNLESVRRNLTLVNSNWTGNEYRKSHGVGARTVYPPIPSRFEDVPWDKRANGFLCLGRVSPEKELKKVIEILSRVRRSHPDVTLRIVGTFGRTAYARSIRQLAATHSGWVSVDEDLSRHELIALLPRYRYGIHGMRYEHFGMAPAELVAAGCIVFVPNSGGQVEVVGGEARLIYGTVDDGVTKIASVLSAPDVQRDLRACLSERRSSFSVEQFMSTIREIVDAFPEAR